MFTSVGPDLIDIWLCRRRKGVHTYWKKAVLKRGPDRDP